MQRYKMQKTKHLWGIYIRWTDTRKQKNENHPVAIEHLYVVDAPLE